MKHTSLIHTTHVVSCSQFLTQTLFCKKHEGSVTGNLETEAAIDMQDRVTLPSAV